MSDPTTNDDIDRRDWYVYVARDCNCEALYVGITYDVARRFMNHGSQRWHRHTCSWEVHGPYRKGVARRIETWTIRQELPYFNGTGNPLVYAYNQRTLARWRAGSPDPEVTPGERYLSGLPRYSDEEVAPWRVLRTDAVYYVETGKARHAHQAGRGTS